MMKVIDDRSIIEELKRKVKCRDVDVVAGKYSLLNRHGPVWITRSKPTIVWKVFLSVDLSPESEARQGVKPLFLLACQS